MDDVEDVRQSLRRLKRRLAGGEIDEPTYLRQRDLLIADLTPGEREELGLMGASPTPGPVPATPSPGPTSRAPGTPVGPSGGSGKGVWTRLENLAQVQLTAGAMLADRWRIERELGRGGFGVVYLARDERLEQTQAVKVLDPSMVRRPELLKRFRREVATMRTLVNPRIARVFEYVEEEHDGLALFSMEYVKGSSVRMVLEVARARKEAVPIGLALAILEQVLEALEAAHSAGVIHRDVTPANILLAGGTAEALLKRAEAGQAGDPQVKLVDFGIAGAIERTELSQKILVMGTPAYVAPEVLDAAVPVTPAADVYGAGAVTYELLTGRLPLGRFEDPSVHREELPQAIEALVLSLLRLDPGRRPSVDQARRTVTDLRREDGGRIAKAATRRRLQTELNEALRKGEEAAVRKALAAVGPEAETATADRAKAFLAQRKREREIEKVAKGLGAAVAQGDEKRVKKEAERLEGLLGIDAARNEDLTKARRWLEERERTRLAEAKRQWQEGERVRQAEEAAQRRREAEQAEEAAQAAQKQREEAQALQRRREAEVWTDPSTGLMWAKWDNGSDVNWEQADQYCREYQGGGFHDWRLPTMAELAAL